METISVRLSSPRDRSYDVIVEAGIFHRLPALLASFAQESALFVITDSTVHRLYGRQLVKDCEKAGLRLVVLVVPPGEASKNAELAYGLQTELLAHGIQRNSLIVALGGGVVGDLAGFVAATIFRGVPFVQVPTTLLAQVDSSVGGKVGIDHPAGKNLIGAFYQPRAVFADPGLLKTLPERQFRNGLAEAAKIAMALDKKFFVMLGRKARSITKTNQRVLTPLIARAIGLKAAVVAKDELESGLRKSLNLGHTIGHAIEAATDFRIAHGEAVSIGMAVEAEIAVDMGLMKESERKKLEHLLRQLRLPIAFPKIRDRKRFLDALVLDKKSTGGIPKFVLPAGIGRSAIGVEVPAAMIESILDHRR